MTVEKEGLVVDCLWGPVPVIIKYTKVLHHLIGFQKKIKRMRCV